MENQTRDFRFALLGISGLSALGYFIHTFVPDTPLQILIFFALVAMTVFGWTLYLIPKRRVAWLTTSIVLLFLLLRLFHLRHPLYIVLLLSFFISLEVLRNKR